MPHSQCLTREELEAQKESDRADTRPTLTLWFQNPDGSGFCDHVTVETWSDGGSETYHMISAQHLVKRTMAAFDYGSNSGQVHAFVTLPSGFKFEDGTQQKSIDFTWTNEDFVQEFTIFQEGFDCSFPANPTIDDINRLKALANEGKCSPFIVIDAIRACIDAHGAEACEVATTPVACIEGEQRCEGNTGFTCINGNWIATHSCGETPPPPPPPPGPELYEVHIETPKNPELPSWLVERMRSLLSIGGYGLNNISRSGTGYICQIEKFGSVTLGAASIVILAILALLLIGIISITWIKLSDNKTERIKAESVESSIQAVIDFCNQNNLSQEECQELIDGIRETYKDIIPPGDDIFGKLTPFLVAGLAIMALSAFKK